MRTPDSRNALNSRLARRWSVHYQIQFAYSDYAGEGMTLDVSERGLCMITNREIAPGFSCMPAYCPRTALTLTSRLLL
jgi:hypothetical protein